jgi:hypothetical protein
MKVVELDIERMWGGVVLVAKPVHMVSSNPTTSPRHVLASCATSSRGLN